MGQLATGLTRDAIREIQANKAIQRSMERDKTRLKKALKAVNASEWHWRAATILYSINGIDNALEYVYGFAETQSNKHIHPSGTRSERKDSTEAAG